jgi:hypothetical protein
MADESAPGHGISLATFASISAALAEGDRPRADVLQAFDLDEARWVDASTDWQRRLIFEAMASDSTELSLEYSARFAEAQDKLKPLLPLSPEDWARLVHDVSSSGLAPALQKRALSEADFARLSRAWTKQLAENRELSSRYFAAFYSLG